MNFFKAGSVVLFSLFTILGKAQTDTLNTRSYADQVMIRVNLDTNIESYTFTQGEDENAEQTTLSINNKTKTSLSLDYRIISATLSFAQKFSTEMMGLKGAALIPISVSGFPGKIHSECLL